MCGLPPCVRAVHADSEDHVSTARATVGGISSTWGGEGCAVCSVRAHSHCLLGAWSWLGLSAVWQPPGWGTACF